MLKGLNKARRIPWLFLCALAIGLGFMFGGVIGALSGAAGCLLGAEIGVALVRWAAALQPEKQAKAALLEPALLPMLINGEPSPERQMRSAIIGLIGAGKLSLDRREDMLWVSDGDSGIATGRCEDVVNLRIQGRLSDGPQRLSSLPSFMTRAHGTCLEDIQKISLSCQEEWSDKKPRRIRLLVAILLPLLGFALVIIGIPFGAIGLGIGAGLYWPSGRQLLKPTPYWSGQRDAWIEKLDDLKDRLPKPGLAAWGQALAMALALGDQGIITQAQERSSISSDKNVKNLVEAAAQLQDS